MYSSRKKLLEEVPQELTAIWSCEDDNCNGWMRDNFSLSIVPVCSQCQSKMFKTERMLPVLANTSHNQIKD